MIVPRNQTAVAVRNHQVRQNGGSTTTASVAPAIHNVCTKALAELQQKSGLADASGEHWAEACKKLGVDPLQVRGEWQEGLSSSGAGGVQFAEVEVDTETGFVKVKKITCVQDGGLIVPESAQEPLAASDPVQIRK